MQKLSLWEKFSEPTEIQAIENALPRKKYSSVSKHLNTEILVIGAGLAGILTAYRLQEKGHRVIIVDAAEAGSGQTKNTTAKITLQHGFFYSDLISDIGETASRLYAEAHKNAIEEYARLVKDFSISCDFERESAYLYSTLSDEKILSEYEAARKLDIPCELTTETSLPFSIVSALRFPEQAQFHPLKFLRVLAAKLELYENSKVLDVTLNKNENGETQTSCAQIESSHGSFIIEAEKIIFACHFPFLNIPGYYFARMHQERSYVLALSGILDESGIYQNGPKAGTPFKGMYYCIDEDTFSFRRAGSYLLLGGGNHRTGSHPGESQYEMLKTAASQFFPQANAAFCWSAQDCMTGDLIPYIGPFSSDTPDWYVITGFKKWGMTSSLVAAGILPDLIEKRSNPYSAVFSPQRHNLSGELKAMLTEGYEASKGLLKSTADLLLSPYEKKRCRHLGCKLTYNQDEDSFDCPCHGSRFAKDGKVLDGPAQEDLRL